MINLEFTEEEKNSLYYERFHHPHPLVQLKMEDKLEFHYTPKHGSWLNMAEIELSVLNRQCLDRRIPDMDSLKQEIKAWEENRNEKSNSVDWRFTTADARIKLKKLYPSIQT